MKGFSSFSDVLKDSNLIFGLQDQNFILNY